MWDWLRDNVPGYDSTTGALIGALTGIGLYISGRWALRRDRMTASEAARWETVQESITAIRDQQKQHELLLSQTMTRSEINVLIKEGNRDLLVSVCGRMDRTDRVRDRAHDELNNKMDLLIGNSIRRREDFEPRRRTHLVDPRTDTDKGRTDTNE